MTTYVVGHANPDTDAVCATIGYAELRQVRGDDTTALVQGPPNPETEYVLQRFGVEAPEERHHAPDGDVALVDHSDRSQAPEGLDPAQIVAVIDHHRVGDIQTTQPIFYLCAPVGSTATLVTELFEYCDETPTMATRGCLLGAILSDTLGFRSPTTTDRDEAIAHELAESLDIDPEAMADEQLRAKADLSGATAPEILRRDLKTYDTSRGRIAIGQVELPHADPILEADDQYREAMAALRSEGYADVVFMVTDLNRDGSYLLVETANAEAYEDAFGIETEAEGASFVPGILSRKKQVVPPLLDAVG